MVIGVHRRAVGVFSHRRDAEQALHELKNSGFAMDRVSIIAKDKDDRDGIAGTQVTEKVGDKSEEGAKVGGISGGTVGGLTGLLIGLGTLAIPGIGPIMLAGGLATALATTLAGAGIGAVAGSLIGGLIGLGIPEERARAYNKRVEEGAYLVIIDGTDAELSRAREILHRRGIEDYEVYDHQNVAHPTSAVHHDVNVPVVPVQTTRRAIGVFSHQRDAESALRELRNAGFPMTQVSLIAKDGNIREKSGIGNKADEGLKAGAATGGALGGLGGLLVGLGALAIPGVGPVIAGGAVATALATTLTGGAVGAAVGGIAGGLVGLGIPEERARIYSDRFQKGDYLLIVDGTEAQIHQAQNILQRLGIEEFAIYDARDVGKHQPSFEQVQQVENVPSHHPGEPPIIVINHREKTV
ncbi:general stress protein [Trichormus sp. NMC-1]|uniref:general stress protein n=1 Tax=Trichormus sp. NMC-1 TaxID=1853259 RepID=UPI0008DBF17B|nr:general stress protein [Trichormus sp. NMC-1]